MTIPLRRRGTEENDIARKMLVLKMWKTCCMTDVDTEVRLVEPKKALQGFPDRFVYGIGVGGAYEYGVRSKQSLMLIPQVRYVGLN